MNLLNTIKNLYNTDLQEGEKISPDQVTKYLDILIKIKSRVLLSWLECQVLKLNKACRIVIQRGTTNLHVVWVKNT